MCASHKPRLVFTKLHLFVYKSGKDICLFVENAKLSGRCTKVGVRIDRSNIIINIKN